jgi:diguanylate cyclase (GGDEF)-like protein/PAS domain S-box-containing protein
MTAASPPSAGSPLALEDVFNAIPDSVFLLDPETSDIVFCNRAAHEDLGYARDEILGHSVLSLQKDVVGLPQWSLIAAEIRKADPYVFMGRHRHKRGHEIPVEVHTRAVHIGGREYFLSSARDITRRRMLETELLSRDEHVRFALNETSDGLWDWHVPSGEVFFSPQLKRMLGYGPHEMTPTLESWSGNVHPEDAERVFQVLSEHLAGQRERFEAEYRLRNRNGHHIWVHDRGKVFERNAQGEAVRVVGMVQNITDQKTLEQQLLEQASHDSLTGLRNRRESEAVLDNLVHTCQRLAVPLGVCMFDLDHFKQINDLNGHIVGDQVLTRVAQQMSYAIRASDNLFRWGGEEFLLLCPGMDHGAMVKLASKLRDEVASMDWAELPGVDQVTASFGIAVMPQDGLQPSALLLAADSALYRARAAGRNCVI